MAKLELRLRDTSTGRHVDALYVTMDDGETKLHIAWPSDTLDNVGAVKGLRALADEIEKKSAREG